MKKSLLALAVLGAFAGAASAQSSVTLYGLIDANIGKDGGSDAKRMAQGGSSRLGFRGSEDLGGGMAANFQIEHRFRPWNGTINGGNGVNGSPVTFWQARSWVGLSGSMGNIRLGREYDGAFFHAEVVADPWGWDTVVSNYTVSVNAGTAVSNFNVNRAVTLNSATFGGLSASIQVAESNDNCGKSGLANTAFTQTAPGSNGITGTPAFGVCAKRPYSGGASYNAGPLSVGFGYNNPGNVNDKWMAFRGSYDLGAVKLWGMIGNGTNTANQKVKSYQWAVTAPVGQAEFRATVYNRKDNGVTNIQGVGLGYFYALSKRTTLYTDYATNSKLATSKNAYDVGIKHTF